MFEILKNSREVLGMNARNLAYIRPNNLRQVKRLADEKLASKQLLKKNGLPVPKLLGKITSRQDFEIFDWKSLPNSFVLKPNQGFGGGGIVVVYGKKKRQTDTWVKASGSSITLDEIKEHTRNILDGNFSLSGIPDVAFFEERLRLHKSFKPLTYRGIPDIRIIVYNRVPVMAMLRLPTEESGGKANLQLGAIGVGIDLANGTTTTAVFGKHSTLLEYVPKSRQLLSGFKIPGWKDILTIAVKAQEASKLGFLGADIAIDREYGPVILELNARPGLQIQIANQNGLKGRLDRIEGLKIKSVSHGVRIGMNLFGGEIEEELESISGRKIIGSTEKITLQGPNRKEIEVKAKIDTGAYSSSIDIALAQKLGYDKLIESFAHIDMSHVNLSRGQAGKTADEIFSQQKNKIPHLDGITAVFSASGATLRPVSKTTLTMSGETFSSRFNIVDRSALQYPVLIGRKDLKRFLIQIT